MKKQEATNLLKEVLAECKLGTDSFILVEPNPNDHVSTGYKIKVKTILDSECREKLIGLSKKYNLDVIEEDLQIIIYKPPPDRKANLMIE